MFLAEMERNIAMTSKQAKPQTRSLDLVRALSEAGRHVFTVADAREYLSHDASLWLALTRLLKTGWIRRLKRGVYLIVPLEAGIARQWTGDVFVIACSLAQPAAVAYWSAMRHWNWTTQVPQTVLVQTTQRKWRYAKTILGVTYRFVPVVPGKFFGVRRERLGAKTFFVTDREKTLLDILDRPDLSGGMPEVLGAVAAASSEIDWKRLDEYLDRFPNRTVLKRLGVLADLLSLDISDRKIRLARWRGMISGGVTLLDPGGSRTSGRINSGWGIRMNLPIASQHAR
jgi:predicted transcriptional regulator of viral defense system